MTGRATRHAGSGGRRTPPAGRSLLHSRWLYVVLWVLVAGLYAWLFTGGTRRSIEPPIRKERVVSTDQLKSQEMDPQQALEVLRRKPSVAWWLGLWGSMATGLCVAGSALSIRAIREGRLATLFRYRPRLPTRWSWGELVRIVLLLIGTAALLPLAHVGITMVGGSALADRHLWGVLSMLMLDSFLILIVLGFAQARGRSFASALGLSRRGDVLFRGLAGYAALFPWIFGLLWVITQVAAAFGIQPPLEPIHELLFVERRTLVVALTMLLACVVGPIAEEVFFRGLIFATLRRRMPRVLAMLVSGAVFAGLHTNLIGFVPITILGCLLADLYERTGSLWSPIAVHVVHNTFLIGLGLTAKELLGIG